MKLSPQTQIHVRNEISRLKLFAAHYSREAIRARWKHRREWYAEQVARFDARCRALTLALEMGGAR